MKSKLCIFAYILSFFIFLNIIYAQEIEVNSLSGFAFVENKGQFESDLLYIFDAKQGKITLKESGFNIMLYKIDKFTEAANPKMPFPKAKKTNILNDAEELSFLFHNANENIQIEASEERITKLNYYFDDVSKGITGVRTFSKIIYKNVWDNIDFEIYQNKAGRLQYDFIVNPNGNPKDIKIKLKNFKKTYIEDNKLIAEGRLGIIYNEEPYVYQKYKNKKIAANFELNGNLLSFNTAKYDISQALIIDPIIGIDGFFYGGNKGEYFYESKSNNDFIYSCGTSTSLALPNTENAYQKTNTDIDNFNGDAFLMKCDTNFNVLWATFFGSKSDDFINGFDFNSANDVVCTGQSNSKTLVLSGAPKPKVSGGNDAFILIFDQDGLYKIGTFYGGNSDDEAKGIAIKENNQIVLVGITQSNFLATSNALINSLQGSSDGFVAIFNPNLSLDYLTYIGTKGSDGVYALALDSKDNISIIGFLGEISPILIKNTAYNKSNPMNNTCIIRFNAQYEVEYGAIWDIPFSARPNILLDKNDNIIISGQADRFNSFVEPNKSTFQKNPLAATCNIIAAYKSDLSSQLWSSYLLGSDSDILSDIKASMMFDNQKENIYIAHSIYRPSINALKNSEYTEIIDSTSDNTFFSKFSVGSGTCVYNALQRLPIFNICAINNSHLFLAGSMFPASSKEGINWINEEIERPDVIIARFEDLQISPENLSKSEVCPNDLISVDYTSNANIEVLEVTLEIFIPGDDSFRPVPLAHHKGGKNGTVSATIHSWIPAGDKYHIRFAGSHQSLPLTILPKALLTINGPREACKDKEFSYTTTLQNGVNIEWGIENGTINSFMSNGIKVTWHDVTKGRIFVYTQNQIGCKDTIIIDVTIGFSGLEIKGETLICASAKTQVYRPSITGRTNVWTVESGGTIIGSNIGPEVTVQWGNTASGSLKLEQQIVDGDCFTLANLNVLIDGDPEPKPKINGLQKICSKNNYTYSSAAKGNNIYTWQVVGGTILNTDKNTIEVKWNPSLIGAVIVTEQTPMGCWTRDTLYVDSDLSNIQLIGESQVCFGDVEYLYYTPSHSNIKNKWQALNGVINGADDKDSVYVTWNTAGALRSLRLTQAIINNQTEECTNIKSISISRTQKTFKLEIPKMTFNPKDAEIGEFSIPVKLVEAACIESIEYGKTFELTLSIKKSFFLPTVNENVTYRDENEWRIITFTRIIDDIHLGDTIVNVKGTLLLADTIFTNILINKVLSNGEEVAMIFDNGSLTLTDLPTNPKPRLIKAPDVTISSLMLRENRRNLDFELMAEKEINSKITISDMLGNAVYSSDLAIKKGNHFYTINLDIPISKAKYIFFIGDKQIFDSELFYAGE